LLAAGLLAVLLVAGAGIGAWLVVSHSAEAPPTRPARAKPAPKARVARDAAPRSRVPVERTASGPAVSRVEIPAIGVKAPMIKLGLNPDESLEVPVETEETGWWSRGAFPGERGTAVIAGDVDSTSGPAVEQAHEVYRAGRPKGSGWLRFGIRPPLAVRLATVGFIVGIAAGDFEATLAFAVAGALLPFALGGFDGGLGGGGGCNSGGGGRG